MAQDTNQSAQLIGLNGYTVDPIFTIGETLIGGSQGDYTPPGILDGLGAFPLDDDTIRILANHELTADDGYVYTLANGTELTGARVSFFDINRETLQVEDAGLAYSKIINRAGQIVDEASDLEFSGIQRLCSAQYIPAEQFGEGNGLVDPMFFTGEETDGGTEFVLDPASNTLYAVPWMGRAAWESVTQLDTGTTDKVAFLIGDDREAAPLLMYVGEKNNSSPDDFLARNGLKNGKLYVWKPDGDIGDSDDEDSAPDPSGFNGTGNTLNGNWVELAYYRPDLAGTATDADGDGTIQNDLGYDELGFATQAQQDQLFLDAGGFQFSRPEDVATNPQDGTEAVLASTGRDGRFPEDSWGTTYKINSVFSESGDPLGAKIDILYDGDDAGNGQFTGSDFGLRSPDNLDWADNGQIYIQEDRSFSEFGLTSGEEASIWQLNPLSGELTRIAQVDRSAVPEGQTDPEPEDIGNWETSGIIDVSNLFGDAPGTRFIFGVQAHSLEDGVIESANLVQGGQLSFLTTTPSTIENPSVLTPIGRYQSDSAEEGAAEISAFDPESKRLFVVNAVNNVIDILDLSDLNNPTLISSIDLSAVGAGGNSVAVKNGVVAVAIESDPTQDPGVVAFYDTQGNLLNQVTVGALPDMITFTPDGTKVLVANEGEPGEDNDPEGSVSIIDISGGVETATVTTAGFTAFNGQEEALRSRGVRIFEGRSFAQDAEPEYITVSEDSTTAYVTLQENNAVAVVDLETGEVTEIQPLGTKNYQPGTPQLTNYTWDLSGEVLGTTPAGQEILLGGMSGLYYEGTSEDGLLQFIATPDRGPNGEPTDVDGDGIDERPFPLPDYQPRLVRFTLNRESGEIAITEQISLFREDGTTPLSGLPNLQGGESGLAYADEEPVDLNGNSLENDPFGADMESVIVVPDGTFWLSDEYRPGIYHFDANGTLIDRFVPQGTAAAVGAEAGAFGQETLPAVYAQRRSNRGFEGMAYDRATNLLYAFIQSPLDNPDGTTDQSSRNSQVLRILTINPVTGEPTAEYVYLLEGSAGVDKIGDAVHIEGNKFYVIERDSGTDSSAKKFIFEVDLTGATNILGTELSTATDADNALEGKTADELAALGIQAVNKTKILNLPSLGYQAGDKTEGLALLDDGSLAVINDNDFGLLPEAIPVDGSVPFNPNPTPTVLGLIEFNPINLDASDEDGVINLQNYPIYGLFMPDAIASYQVGEATYYITANEGDARDEDVRLADVTLDPNAFPNAAELQADNVLGRLTISSIDGDLDGDGDYDQIFTYGGRSFSIWDSTGNLVYDSGDELATITSELFPGLFNSQGTTDSFDNRSDDKGTEPEGVVVGEINGRNYAFIGLERIGGVMVYDVSDPTSPEFISYANPTDEAGNAIDIGPEGLTFISGEDSPNGEPALVVTNEISNSTTIFNIDLPLLEESDLNTEIFRFRRLGGDTSSYLFAGGTEAENIRTNFADTYVEEGLAFKVSQQDSDELIPLYRFQSNNNPGRYLYVGEEERANINQNFSTSFTEEGLAFYVFGVGAGAATEFTRFRNLNSPENYLYATGEEAQNIRTNFATTFEEEGTAFEVDII